MDVEPLVSVSGLLAFARESNRLMIGGLVSSIRECGNESYSLWKHSLAVASTARRLALELGLSIEERRLTYLGGLLHDVGKTALAPATLFKPGPLNAAERDHLNLHPALGAGMVADLGIGHVSDAVHYHHELFDGSGYPFGLARDEIPLVARVVGVADYFEALCESRPYRPLAATSTEALEVIGSLARAGKLDPEITNALPSVAQTGSPIPSRYFDRVAGFFELTF